MTGSKANSSAWENGRIGKSSLRVEDDLLLRGRGRFLDDVDIGPTALHCCFVRSPHAHALIQKIDASQARNLESVVSVWTADDVVTRIKPIVADFARPGFKPVPRCALAQGQVRFVGESIALVIATDAYAAVDASELIEIDFDERPAIIEADVALRPESPTIHSSIADNVLFESTFETKQFLDTHLASPIRQREYFKAARMAAVSIEPRGCAARYDRTNRFLTVWSSTQVPHILHSCLSEHLGLRHSDIRVIAPDVGGGFGMKALVYPEELLVAAAALEFDRPVKWIQDRYDDLISSAHARDHSYDVDFGFDSEGRLLSVDADVIVNIGAYPMLPFGSSLEANGAPRNLPGAYTLQNFRFRARAIATNTCPTGAYRGVSAPLSCFVMEGIMDRIARHLGIDPAEVRRRNLVREFPYQNVLGQTYTDGCFLPSLEQALSTIDYKGLRNRQRNAHEHEACLYGIGISVITEQTGMASSRYRARGAFRIPGFEAASARVEPDGTVVAAVSLAAQGQGHQTVFSQIISERLGVEIDQIRIVEGDTANTPFGSGAFASRGMVIAGSALDRVAIKIRDKMAAIAAHHLECGAHDLVFASGHAHVNGVTDLRISIQEIAAIAYSRESRAMPTDMSFGLEASEVCDPPSPVVGSAVHIASVKIQKHTGCVEIDRYVVVHDCGLMINPALVDGQIQGGVVQGLGEVLMEHFQYDSTGQPLSVSLLDYQIPRSCNIGAIQIEECHQQTAPAQFKGVGESGTIGAVPAITNAIGDALSSHNCKVNKLPLTASDIRKLIASDVSKQTSIGAATPVMASE